MGSQKDGGRSAKSSAARVQGLGDRKLGELRGKLSRLSVGERGLVWKLVDACADCLIRKCVSNPEGCPTYAAILKEKAVGLTEASAKGTKSGPRARPA